jgi:hypothetical protein
MIIILDDILTEDECKNLIDIYQKNKENTHTHGNPTFYPLNIKNILAGKDIALEAAKRIEKITNKYYNLNIIDWCEIVKWPCNSWQSYHLDTASKETSLTSITYLNENFDGGCTIMHDGTKVKPKTGRTVIFDGNKYIHGVEPILKGERYTLPIWYKNTIRELI